MNKEALAERLRGAFLEDLEEQMRIVEAELLELEQSPGDEESLKALFRAFHTLKGGAQAAGLPEIATATHALESLLSDVRAGTRALGPGQFRLLFAAADALRGSASAVRAGASLSDSALGRLRPALAAGELAPEPTGAETDGQPPGGEGVTPDEDAVVRVQADKLDALAGAVGQILMVRAGAAAGAQRLEGLNESLAAWAREAHRALRQVGVTLDHLRASPDLMHRLESLDERLKELLRESAQIAARGRSDTRAFGQVADELASQVNRVRMRPFREIAESLPRAVRDIAAQLKKEVRVVVTGGSVEADRAVLAGVRDALLHLARNAVDHGIEAPEQRERAGKPRGGTLQIDASLRGQTLEVTLSDDGRGIDVAALRAARERQDLPPIDDQRELIAALLSGGLSSRREVTAVSGRGVGLDAARAAMHAIRGSIDLSWTSGQGTRVTLVAPLTLMTIRALLVRVSGQAFAIPTVGVSALARIRPEDVRRLQNRDVVEHREGPVPLSSVARLLGPPLVTPARTDRMPTLFLSAGDARLALVVDEARTEQELVVRPLQRAKSPFLAGAAILGTGEVALVLDVPSLVAAGTAATGSGIGQAPGAKTRQRRRILVVDDSITTRTLEQSSIEAAGYEVLTAVDGADAWRLLQEHGFDAIVSDVEMPKMDGFALCQAVRGSARLKALPIVLVTGLESDEHRARGMEVGADAYIGKSSFDQQHLLDTLAQLVGE